MKRNWLLKSWRRILAGWAEVVILNIKYQILGYEKSGGVAEKRLRPIFVCGNIPLMIGIDWRGRIGGGCQSYPICRSFPMKYGCRIRGFCRS